jgi:hypothetical protein
MMKKLKNAFVALTLFGVITSSLYSFKYYSDGSQNALHMTVLTSSNAQKRFDYCIENKLRLNPKFAGLCKEAFYTSTKRFRDRLYDLTMVIEADSLTVGSADFESVSFKSPSKE